MRPNLKKYTAIILFLTTLIAAQCGPENRPAPLPTAPPPTPTPQLIPPIQPGDGSDVMDRLLETGVLRVGLRVWPEANFSPPAFRGFSNAPTGGALNGFEVDIAHRLAEHLGLELELIEAPPLLIAGGDWRNAWDIALASLVPFDQPLAGSPAQTIIYSQPYGYLPLGVLVPAQVENIQSLAQLAGQRVGVLEHTAEQRLLSEAEPPLTVQGQPILPAPVPQMQLIVLSNLPKEIRELGQPENEDGAQLDAIIGPAPILQEAIKREFPVKLAPDAAQVALLPLAVAAKPQDGLAAERLVAEINQILDRLQRDGTLAEIYLRWYSQDFSRPPALENGE